MVAHTPTPLPTLNPEDKSLLRRYFAACENPGLIGTPHPPTPPSPSPLVPDLLDLYAFLSRPDIAAWVAFHHAHKEHIQRELALDNLAAICKDSLSPIERRRAATTLLRALAQQLTSSKPKRLPDPPVDPAGQRSQVGRASGPPSDHPAHSVPPGPNTPPPTTPISRLISLQGTIQPNPHSYPDRTRNASSAHPDSS